MNREQLKKINGLVKILDQLNGVLAPCGDHRVSISRHDSQTGTYLSGMNFDWHIIVPTLAAYRDMVKEELKGLGYDCD